VLGVPLTLLLGLAILLAAPIAVLLVLGRRRLAT
jgi:hypothetical protein